jgi:hypothetical protein
VGCFWLNNVTEYYYKMLSNSLFLRIRVYLDGAASFFPIICGDVLTLNLNYEAFADRGRDSVARDTQVGSHVCPLDAVQEQRLPIV